MAGGADWLEAGTPLIKSEGLQAVRELKRRYPDQTIVADMKTMDAGRAEVEYAAKAGANVVGVLGAASDATIRECVEAARNYGGKIIVDMIEVDDLVARAKAAEAMGAELRRHPHRHRRADARARPRSTSCATCAEAVSIPVAVAGGINSETAAAAVEAGAAIVVVGGAITKATDAARRPAEIRQRPRRACLHRDHVFERATEAGIRAVLAQVSTANVSDALHRRRSLPGLRPLLPGAQMVRPGRHRAHLPGRLGQAGRGHRPLPARRRARHRRRRQLPRHLGRAGHPLAPSKRHGRRGHLRRDRATRREIARLGFPPSRAW